VSEKRVKLHVFEPSQRQVWTVVGMGKEYWIAPDHDYCSCDGYYFSKAKSCYHLESLREAQKQENIEIIKFSDDEYLDFLKSLVSEL
jgi:predicted nucleic acid-binding Zn finger protein